jgi:hypothetical protein
MLLLTSLLLLKLLLLLAFLLLLLVRDFPRISAAGDHSLDSSCCCMLASLILLFFRDVAGTVLFGVPSVAKIPPVASVSAAGA